MLIVKRSLLMLLSITLAGSAFAEELPRDTRLQTGTLENGLNWIYRSHANPPGKMALIIHVDSGSLNETERQRGLAHFLEHMAFNGTENFPPGELIPYFESIGMEFGADLNAFTSFDQTAYMLFLPNTTVEEVDRALMMLSDQVYRALLLEEEIEKERGVILAEKNTRENVQERIREKLWPRLFKGTRFAERLPIGTEEVIKTATREDFVDYYRTWYRPDRMTLIMVGDAPFEQYKSSVEKWFGQYRADRPARPERGPEFKPFAEQRAMVVTDPEFAGADVSMMRIMPGNGPTRTKAQWRADLVDTIAGWIMDRRLSQMVQRGDAAFRNASVGASGFFGDAIMAIGQAGGEPEDWRKMLTQIVVETKRAREHGFSERELNLARKELLANAERAVRTEATRPARAIMMQIASATNDNEPVMSATQRRDLMRELLPAIEVGELNSTFRKHFEPGKFAYIVQMPEKEDVVVPSEADVLAAAREALAQPVTPLNEDAGADRLLAADPRPGKLVEQSMYEPLEISHGWFDNGIRIHHRFMDYREDSVQVTISLAGGKIEETAKNAGITEAAALAVNQAATRRLTSSQIEDLMTGKNISVRATPGQDAFTIAVSGSPDDLPAGLELVHALLNEGVIEESAFENWKQNRIQQYQFMSKNPMFVGVSAMRDVMSGGDPRLTTLTPDQIEALTQADAQAWFERITAAPIEVSVVGELRRTEAFDLVARFVGSLAKRPRTAEHLAALRTLPRKPGPWVRHERIDTMTPQALVLTGFMGADRHQHADVQALQLASNILSSKLIEKVREEQSLVYSLGAQSQPGSVYKDSGMFLAFAPCPPSNIDKVFREIDTIMERFNEVGPTQEELDNAIKQVLNNLDEEMKEPSFWTAALQHHDLHNRDLEHLRTLPDTYKQVTTEQVHNTFRKYYQDIRKFAISSAPEGAAPLEPGQASAGG